MMSQPVFLFGAVVLHEKGEKDRVQRLSDQPVDIVFVNFIGEVNVRQVTLGNERCAVRFDGGNILFGDMVAHDHNIGWIDGAAYGRQHLCGKFAEGRAITKDATLLA